MRKFSRRDFLKLGWSIFGGGLVSTLIPKPARLNKYDGKLPNIVVLVCDAMTARNLSIYGYSRKTTPNLEKLAEQAFVYHNHFSSGNFTVPGTSSLLTGLRPWTHQAINLAGVVGKKSIEHNIFRLLGNEYFKLAFSQNYWAADLLHQFSSDINSLLPASQFGSVNGGAIYKKFQKDPVIAFHSLEEMFYYRKSLLLSFIFGLYYKFKINAVSSENYPAGFPVAQFYDNVFTMEDLFDGISSTILELDEHESPYFSYFHIFPPHDPYNPHKDFAGRFDDDGYKPMAKRDHVLSDGTTQPSLDNERNRYDAFIANIDMEIGRLVASLKSRGVLDNTYFIITSDHGEMFERGTVGHTTPMLYDPVIRIPLLVLVPGNQTRQDFPAPTSNIDLLPTILGLTGMEIPASCEGTLLPGLGGIGDSNRAIITMDAKESPAHKPFTKATYSIIKGNYKLIYYSGYIHKYQDYFEFYDLKEDPEELQDKYSKPRFSSIISEMRSELFLAMDEANRKLS
ncbi:MAG: sulfatase-like hydrolase/transferase [Anaerolineales bacterium]|nr:sulfatase-like hydrolase/transferase [Anaerolineales bacterium]